MCGRAVVALDSAALLVIAKARNMRNAMRFNPSYNVAPGRYIPGMFKNNNKDEEEKVLLEAMKWGTQNSKDLQIINARSENVSIFYKNWKRCVVIIDGYYEWKKISSQSNIDLIINNQPYYIKDKNKKHLLVAGVYQECLDEEGFDEKEVLIMTKSANKHVEHIHKRMPVILDESLSEDYLEEKITYEELINKSEGLYIELNAYPIGDLVNKISNKNKDNIIHKDEINYDKNKNLKLTNFFVKKSENKNEEEEAKLKYIEEQIKSSNENEKEVKAFKIIEENLAKVTEKEKDKDDLSTQISLTEVRENKKGKKRKFDSSPNKVPSSSKKKKIVKPSEIKYNTNIMKFFINNK